MIMKNLAVFIILCFGSALAAQDQPVDFVKKQAQNQEIYAHFDKSFYVTGETIWFSIYNVKADDHKLIFGRRYMEFAIIDKNSQIISKERIRVLDGKSWGQFTIPPGTATGNYLFIITYPYEDANNFLYRKVIPIFNSEDDLSDVAQIAEPPSLNTFDELDGIKNSKSKLTITTNKKNYKRRETILIELNIEEELTAKASIVVRKKGLYSSPLDIRSLALDPKSTIVQKELNQVQLTNFRENKYLKWRLIDSHGLLLYELIQTDSVDDASIPSLYIPEDRTTHDIIEVKKGRFVFDATGLSGDRKSLYFTNFSYGKWGAIPLGEVKYDWLNRRSNYKNVLPEALERLPVLTPAIKDYINKVKFRHNITAAFGDNFEKNEEINRVDALRYRTVMWFNVDEYSQMSSLIEFLKEVVQGVKIWEKRGIYDLRIFYVGGRYAEAPFFLINGVPTWDQQRVLNLPIKDILGVGVIKDLRTQTGQARDARKELENFGYYGANGILSIELRPDVINPFQTEFNSLLKQRFYLGAVPYIVPDYTNSDYIYTAPDFRPVLYWNPDVVFGKEGNPNLSFSASDDAGEYEIIIEGIGKNGEILYDKKSITIGLNPDN